MKAKQLLIKKLSPKCIFQVNSCHDKAQINAEINDEPNFEHSSLTQTISNTLTRSCDFKDEPVFSPPKQSFGEQLKAVSHQKSLGHLPTSLGMDNKSKHRGA